MTNAQKIQSFYDGVAILQAAEGYFNEVATGAPLSPPFFCGAKVVGYDGRSLFIEDISGLYVVNADARNAVFKIVDIDKARRAKHIIEREVKNFFGENYFNHDALIERINEIFKIADEFNDKKTDKQKSL